MRGETGTHMQAFHPLTFVVAFVKVANKQEVSCNSCNKELTTTFSNHKS